MGEAKWGVAGVAMAWRVPVLQYALSALLDAASTCFQTRASEVISDKPVQPASPPTIETWDLESTVLWSSSISPSTGEEARGARIVFIPSDSGLPSSFSSVNCTRCNCMWHPNYY